MGFNHKMRGKHVCEDCASFPICSKFNIKNVEATTDSCMWNEDYYYKKEKKDE